MDEIPSEPKTIQEHKTITVSVPTPATPAQEEEVASKTAGQRKVNLLWEITQSAIAIISVSTGMVVFILQAIGNQGIEFPPTLNSMIFVILGFYFARTNHQAIGGVGSKPEQPYQGR